MASIEWVEAAEAWCAECEVPPPLMILSEEIARPNQLSDGEKAVLTRLKHVERQASYLRGRWALKELLRQLGQSDDTAALSWPCGPLSLSHTSQLAVAIGWPALPKGVLGVGVDLERTDRLMSDRVRPRILPELPKGALETEAIRLWTVKEALWKAHPQNQMLVVTDCQIQDWVAQTGVAGYPPLGPIKAEYGSWRVEGHWLSIAICR